MSFWARLSVACRVLFRGDGRYAAEVERDDGWTDFIHPSAPSYMLECCDCGLIHEMRFSIQGSGGVVPEGCYNEGETPDGVIFFQARRA